MRHRFATLDLGAGLLNVFQEFDTFHEPFEVASINHHGCAFSIAG